MGQILAVYMGLAIVICHFFRKFCQDPDDEEIAAQAQAQIAAEAEAAAAAEGQTAGADAEKNTTVQGDD